MPTEQRLIDKCECLELLGDAEQDALLEDECEAETIGKCIRLIKGMSTVDAVEVVRCQNCGHHSSNGCLGDRVWCRRWSRYMDADGFCSCGWRE